MKRDAESRTQPAVPAERAGAPLTRTSVDDRIVIRPFESDDAAAVRALFITVNRLMAPPHLAVRFETYIARALREEIDTIASYYAARGGQFFVATAAGELVGMVGFELAEPGVAELRRMYVDPQFRRRGLGRELLAHAETEVRKADCTRLILSTSELQAAALALYRTAGYREIRQDVATQDTNKTLGGAVRRFHFERTLHRDGGPDAAGS
ncbi:N-acetyltransferase [Maritimibacter sp. 55A14]|uniref:GNAT family N-acetyltransferase n=1 Tax=Maritimibacter sp. 55A14 TaxID=2174844 RepID=UPI000D60E44A|nr:GNAT family N-acetyltransferase [Maritimibacter sp. 55A14]PWE29884.1 N-acetyltransferase [Maritimibacter sp. 55A14]